MLTFKQLKEALSRKEFSYGEHVTVVKKDHPWEGKLCTVYSKNSDNSTDYLVGLVGGLAKGKKETFKASELKKYKSKDMAAWYRDKQKNKK